MSSKTRVLMIVTNLQIANGVTSFAMNYYRKLDHDKVHVDFLVFQSCESPYVDELLSNGSQIFVLPPITNITKHFQECKRIIETGNYDIVHDNTLIISLPIMMCAKKANVRVRILHSHTAGFGDTLYKKYRNKTIYPLLRAQATDYAACSQKAGGAFKKRNFTIIHNVIDEESNKFNASVRQEVRERMQVVDKHVITTVARVSPEKNPYFAVDVIECLLATHPNTQYWWIGQGTENDELAEYVEKKGLSEHILLLGNRIDVKDFYQAADCFFLPSIFEGLPLTGVEAQAFGLPCVISDVVTEELVYTDLIKYVSLREPMEAWAQYLSKQMQRQVDRASYGELLSQSVFSGNNAGKTLFSYYQSLLSKNS
ncbi:MAG: glycosyltransferase [Erysipelotrichaceae bacterium]|nr:glycosyltransferase [Erysipelotrichaceae bacterium]